MTPDWIAADWGTTHLRCFAMGPDGVLAEASSEDGMGRLTRDGFEPALLRLVEPWLRDGVPILACGMVGSQQGWAEAPYRAVPCAPLDPGALARVPALDARLDVRIVPGLMQKGPADVMRGEETQIAGLLADAPGWTGTVCLPGTHSKWVRVEGGIVTGFRTFMTGEIFALLSRHSVLRHTVAGDGTDEATFLGAVERALRAPEDVAASLFALRAEALLVDLGPVAARARLSGLLIGTELAATRTLWDAGEVTLIRSEALLAAYDAALSAQGAGTRRASARAMVLAGLGMARP